MDRSEATMEAIGIPIPPRSDASTPTSPTGPSSNSQQQSSSLRERGFTLGNLMRRPRSGTTGSSTGGNGTGVAAGTSEQQSILRAPSMLRGFNIRREPEGANPEQQQQSRSGSVSLNGGHPNLSAGPLSAGLPASSPRMQQSSHSRRSSAPDTPTTEQSNPASSSHVSDKKAFHIKLVPHLELSSRSLHFEPVSRTIKPGHTLKIGRFNERSASHTQATNANALDCSRVAFKSKVVSRQHAELFLDNKEDGSPPTLWAKDTNSSSGSFLNHIRLSGPGLESRLFQVKDGDVLQLGVDYQGGTEEMYRCVKMRVEINRNWQKGVSQFNVTALKRALGHAGAGLPGPGQPASSNTEQRESSSKSAAPAAVAAETTDCCICLFAVSVCQALFIAPCSHVYHYKCIRPLLQMHHPGFSCPLCRTFADLDADVEEDDELFGQPDGGDSNSSEEDSASPSAAMATQAADTTHSLEDDPLDTVAFPSTRSRSSSIHSRRPHGSTNRISSSADAPDAGDFQADMRRSSLSVAGPHGHAAALGHITVTGRSSRPGSVRNLDTGAQTPGSERRSLHHLPSMDELPLFQNPQHGHNGDDSLNRDHSPRDSGETASQPTASDDNLLSRVPTCVERRHNGTATDVNAMEQESSQEAGQQQQ